MDGGMRKADMPSAVAEALFSKVQRRVLALFFGQPERSFQGAELVRLADSGVGAVYRQIRRLLACELITTEPMGQRELYRANENSPVFEELRSLILKTVGLSLPLEEALRPFENTIRAAFVYGSVARGDDGASSDVDLMVIGEELSYPDILAALRPVEKTLNRQISLSLITYREWMRGLREGKTFMKRILQGEKIFVMGSERDIE